MELYILDNFSVAVLSPETAAVSESGGLFDIMADAGSEGAGALVMNKNQMPPGFFDLKNGIAGEILQKFSNYRFRLAVVGDFSGITGKSLKGFIRESNRTGRILFVESIQEALERWNHTLR